MLPHWVKDYLNEVLQDSGGYTGHIQDIDMHLYRGAYVIQGLEFVKKDNQDLPPLIQAPHIDLSVEWKSLFQGRIVGEIILDSTVMNIIFADNKENQQTGEESDWVEIVTQLLPIQINRMALHNGKINFNYKGVNSSLTPLDVELTNIRNVTNPDSLLPSKLNLRSAIQPYGGNININGRANLIKQGLPNFDYNAKLEDVRLEKTQDLMEQFTNMDFEAGSLNVYNEIAVRQNNINGYIKPILKDAKIFKWKEEDRSFLEGIAEAITEGVKEIVENPIKKTTATRLPINGQIKDTNVNYWIGLLTLLKNAFWKALESEIDNSVEYRTKKTEK